MLIWGPAYAWLVAALTFAEFSESRKWQYILKPLAALSFCLIAVKLGALTSLYGQLILAGLMACALGDVCLLSREKPVLFKAGMAAFALGHILYAVAFHSFDMPARPHWVTGLPIVAGFAFFIWLKPKLPKDMIISVAGYTGIIILMVMAAIDVRVTIVPVAATMFAASDMFVARDRFVSRSLVNALAITPLYFGSQALFALSISFSEYSTAL